MPRYARDGFRTKTHLEDVHAMPAFSCEKRRGPEGMRAPLGQINPAETPTAMNYPANTKIIVITMRLIILILRMILMIISVRRLPGK